MYVLFEVKILKKKILVFDNGLSMVVYLVEKKVVLLSIWKVYDFFCLFKNKYVLFYSCDVRLMLLWFMLCCLVKFLISNMGLVSVDCMDYVDFESFEIVK